MGTTKEQAYEKIKILVERFDEQVDEYKKGNYNETMTRIDFIDPFFKGNSCYSKNSSIPGRD